MLTLNFKVYPVLPHHWKTHRHMEMLDIDGKAH